MDNPELLSDFNTLKNSLQQCIPFIRLYNLTSKEFMNIISFEKNFAKGTARRFIKNFLNLIDRSSDIKVSCN